MNFDQWTRDRAGFRTSVEMVTGGKSAMFGDFAGPEVGANYQGGMGEERTEPTYVSSNAMHEIGEAPGSMAASGRVTPGQFQKKETTGFGKSTLRAPQNYRLFGGGKD
jgi:hypothetical protein